MHEWKGNKINEKRKVHLYHNALYNVLERESARVCCVSVWVQVRWRDRVTLPLCQIGYNSAGMSLEQDLIGIWELLLCNRGRSTAKRQVCVNTNGRLVYRLGLTAIHQQAKADDRPGGRQKWTFACSGGGLTDLLLETRVHTSRWNTADVSPAASCDRLVLPRRRCGAAERSRGDLWSSGTADSPADT